MNRLDCKKITLGYFVHTTKHLTSNTIILPPLTRDLTLKYNYTDDSTLFIGLKRISIRQMDYCIGHTSNNWPTSSTPRY